MCHCPVDRYELPLKRRPAAWCTDQRIRSRPGSAQRYRQYPAHGRVGGPVCPTCGSCTKVVADVAMDSPMPASPVIGDRIGISALRLRRIYIDFGQPQVDYSSAKGVASKATAAMPVIAATMDVTDTAVGGTCRAITTFHRHNLQIHTATARSWAPATGRHRNRSGSLVSMLQPSFCRDRCPCGIDPEEWY